MGFSLAAKQQLPRNWQHKLVEPAEHMTHTAYMIELEQLNMWWLIRWLQLSSCCSSIKMHLVALVQIQL